MNRGLLAWSTILVLAGCATGPDLNRATPDRTLALDPTAAPDGNTGYVAGAFSVTKVGWTWENFAFRVADPKGGGNLIPFAESHGERDSAGAPRVRVQMIAISPGEYRVDSWVTFQGPYSMQSERTRQAIDPGHGLARSFIVKPGHVVFLGQFSAKVEENELTRKIDLSIQPEAIRADAVPDAIAGTYSRFAGTPVECLLCVKPAPGAARFAAPIIAPAEEPSLASKKVPEQAPARSGGDSNGPPAGAGGWWAPGSSQR